MSLPALKNYLVQSIQDHSSSLQSRLGEADPKLLLIIGATVLGLIVLLMLGLLIRVLLSNGKREKVVEEPEDSGRLEVVVRDLNTRVLNYITQAREDVAFLKKEVGAVRSELGEFKILSEQMRVMQVLEEKLGDLSGWVASFIHSARDENGARAQELKEMKSILLRILVMESERAGEKLGGRASAIKEFKSV